jgi:hypothetical protein
MKKLASPLLLALLLAASCAGTEEPVVDYSAEEAWYRRAPRSVIVLPARNDTTAAEAGRLFISTISKPLIERGYYVYPPEVVAEILRREGIYDEQAWDIPPQNFRRYLGADAVLYVRIRNWDTSYVVVASSVAVALEYRLVDTVSGDTIWQDERVVARSSGDSMQVGGDALTWLIFSTVNATVTAISTDYVTLANEANSLAVREIYPGVYNPGYDQLQQEIEAWRKSLSESGGANR